MQALRLRAGIVIAGTTQDRVGPETVIGDRSTLHKHAAHARIIADGCGTIEVNRCVAEPNKHPKPYTWTADADRVLAGIARGKRTSEPLHQDL